MRTLDDTLATRLASDHPRLIWLDSVAGGWDGVTRVAWLEDDDPSLVYRADRREVRRCTARGSEVVGTDIFEVLGDHITAEGGEWFGYLGYAARADLPAAAGGRHLDAVWMRPSRVETFLTSIPDAPAVHTTHRAGNGAVALVDEDRYRRAFDVVQGRLRRGETYETNLTYRTETTSDADPLEVYLRLRRDNPAPYAAYLQHDLGEDRCWLLCSSPERFARIGPDGLIEVRPIKGTTPRGANAAEDERLSAVLRHDPKFLAENLMVLDLVRNDLGSVCQLGSVTVPASFEVESYPSVHQLVSTVRGRLRPEVGTVDAIRSIFPAGSMTGAPKRRTMSIIEDVEWTARGPYSGAFGTISSTGAADLGVTIRSLATDGGGSWVTGTGGGITVGSVVGDELVESVHKIERLVSLLSSPGDGSSDD